MKRALFNLVALVSAVLCAALLLAWQRSPWGYDGDSQRRLTVGDTAYFLGSWNGGLRLVRQRVSGGGAGLTARPDRLGCWRIESDGFPSVATRFGPEEPATRILGFGFDFKQYTYGTATGGPRSVPFAFTTDYAVVAVPHWLLFLLAAWLPALWVRRWRRIRQREVTGHCPQCGYDLRAAPDSIGALLPRCPECGSAEGEEPAPRRALR